jgi:hypothetical protein
MDYLFQECFDRKTCFLKVHAPADVIRHGAERMGLKKPIKNYIVTSYSNAFNDIVTDKLYFIAAWASNHN